MTTAVAVALAVASSLATAQDACSQDFNASFGPFFGGHTATDHHVTLGHTSIFTNGHTSCSYTGQAGHACAVTAVADQDSPGYNDTGMLDTYPVGNHVGTSAVQGGVATAAAGGAASVHSLGAVSFKYCLSPSCMFSLSISGSATTGWSANFAPDQVWGDTYPVDVSCPGRTAPPAGGGGTCGTQQGRTEGCGPSPLIFDISDVGVENIFSDPQTDCVLFDINGDGKPLCVSWPYDGAGGWLVLPDENGNVLSVKQLFGNNTPQPGHLSPQVPPNGMNALAEWDLPVNGGNSDLMLSKADEAWSGIHGRRRLRIWTDTHCRKNPGVPCTADPSDLHAPEEFGYENISLMYGPCPVLNDKFGNHFWYCTHVNVKPNKLAYADQDSRLLFDVYLQVRKP
jgi:hypothetical protein